MKVHQSKFGNDKDKFEVSQIMYGKLTDSRNEQAVVVASCGPQVPAHPGFENDLVYVYGIEDGQPELLATFAWGTFEFHGSGHTSSATRPTDTL